jgi:hypothetical protein
MSKSPTAAPADDGNKESNAHPRPNTIATDLLKGMYLSGPKGAHKT